MLLSAEKQKLSQGLHANFDCFGFQLYISELCRHAIHFLKMRFNIIEVQWWRRHLYAVGFVPKEDLGIKKENSEHKKIWPEIEHKKWLKLPTVGWR